MTAEQTDDGRRTARWPWRTLFAIWLVYLLTAQGRVGVEDAASMLNLSRSLLSGSISVPDGPLTVSGADGRIYCHYGPLTSVWWMPFVLAGRGLHALGAPLAVEGCEKFTVSFASGAISVACLGYLCWYWVERGVPSRRMRAGLWLWGIATCLWPYSRLPGSDLIMGLAVLAAVVHFELRREQARHLCLVGLWLGLAVLSRKQAQTIVPIVGLWMVWRCRDEAHAPRRASGGLAQVGWMAAGTAGPLLAQLAYNQARYGNPLIEKYAQAGLHPLTLGLWCERIARLLSGWEHGFLVFNTVAVLVVVVAMPGRSSPGRRLLCLWWVLLVTQVAFLAVLPFWDGGVCFGSRFLVFLALMAGLLWPDAPCAGAGRPRLFFGAAAGLGVVVQLLGVLVDPLAGVRRAELEQGRAPNQSIGMVLESLRVLRIPGGELSPGLAADPVMRHPAFQVPDFWWCQALQTGRPGR